jgi:hypothetical protein
LTTGEVHGTDASGQLMYYQKLAQPMQQNQFWMHGFYQMYFHRSLNSIGEQSSAPTIWETLYPRLHAKKMFQSAQLNRAYIMHFARFDLLSRKEAQPNDN